MTGPAFPTGSDEQTPTLLQFTRDLAARLPGTWSAGITDISTGTARSDLHEQLWDNAVASWILGEFAYQHAGYLKDEGLRALIVLPRPNPHIGQYAIAPLLPALIGTAYEFEDLSLHGVTVGSDPARAASAVRIRLLPRYNDALRTVLRREISPSTATSTEAASGTAADEPAPELEQESGYVWDGRRWQSDPRDAQVLRDAVRALLVVAVVRFDEELTGASGVLAGGGEYICDHHGLDPNLAPVIEAAALTTVLEAAGLRVHSLLDPALPGRLQQLESWPEQQQRQAFQHAASLLAPQPVQRPGAARVRSVTHLGVIRSTTAVSPPVSTPPAAQLPARPTL